MMALGNREDVRMTDRLELAQLWQSILQTDPNQLFGGTPSV